MRLYRLKDELTNKVQSFFSLRKAKAAYQPSDTLKGYRWVKDKELEKCGVHAWIYVSPKHPMAYVARICLETIED